MSEKVLLLINLHAFKVERALSCHYWPFNYSESIGCVSCRGARPLGYFNALKVILTLDNYLWLFYHSRFSNTIVSPDLKVPTDLSPCLKLGPCVWLFGQT